MALKILKTFFSSSSSDELLLPHMKRMDGMITDNRRRLLPKLRMGQLFKVGLPFSG